VPTVISVDPPTRFDSGPLFVYNTGVNKIVKLVSAIQARARLGEPRGRLETGRPVNKTKIEYADYTSNPVTGCSKGCSYPGWADWIIIGAMTGPGAVKPETEWVQRLINAAETKGIPVFLKDNLGWPLKRQEFPRRADER